MGKLWDVVQEHIDAQVYGASIRSVASRLKISPTALTNWRDPKSLPRPEHLRALADLTGTPYLRVLDAALEDAGYHAKAGEGHVRSAPMSRAGASPAESGSAPPGVEVKGEALPEHLRPSTTEHARQRDGDRLE